MTVFTDAVVVFVKKVFAFHPRSVFSCTSNASYLKKILKVAPLQLKVLFYGRQKR